MRLDLLIAFWFMFILIIGAAALLNLIIIIQFKKRLPKIKKNIAIAMCYIFYPDEYKNYKVRKDLKK